MTSPIPRDRTLLSQVSSALEEAVVRSGLEPSANLRLRLLEGVAARVGGYVLKEFDRAVPGSSCVEALTADSTVCLTEWLSQAVLDSPIPPSLALAAVGDSELDPVARRREGRYFTDSGLALNLTSSLRDHVVKSKSILDPACGAGVLLVAAALQAEYKADRRAHLVRDVLWGVDRDCHAIRAARVAISSLTSDLDAVAGLCRHLFVKDSLACGREWWGFLSGEGFDLVVGNPPWEKLKVTRHEHALSEGHQRHYGDDYDGSAIDEGKLRSDRRDILEYCKLAGSDLAFQGRGEFDLYKMFVELGAWLTSDSGALAFLVPGGFIRNDGASELREWLFRNFDVDISILDNRERYFEIDSRFKFVQLLASRGSSESRSVRFGMGHPKETLGGWRTTTDFSELRNMQIGFAIPEVRDRDDWELFTRLQRSHPKFGSSDARWLPRFYREVDMTGDRSKFNDPEDGTGGLPLVEGRMVHQHRVSAKRYISGRGRRAEWEVQPQFNAPLKSQWLIQYEDLRPGIKARINEPRAGFCDITGQTNERTVLAALIPAGVVCGNKVPTVDFSDEIPASVWVGIANGFTFDWLTRRSVTTTLNFFMLRSLPIPAWDPENPDFLAISEGAESLAGMEIEGGEEDLWEFARIRASVEVSSAKLYGISVKDFDHMMRDFPQVDKAQLPIPGEAASTITRDIIVASGEGWATPGQVEQAQERLKVAKSVGSVPFVPNQHARAYGRKQ